MLTMQRRSAVRIASPYRTVSGTAVIAIAAVSLVDMLAPVKSRVHEVNSKDHSTAQYSLIEGMMLIRKVLKMDCKNHSSSLSSR